MFDKQFFFSGLCDIARVGFRGEKLIFLQNQNILFILLFSLSFFKKHNLLNFYFPISIFSNHQIALKRYSNKLLQ